MTAILTKNRAGADCAERVSIGALLDCELVINWKMFNGNVMLLFVLDPPNHAPTNMLKICLTET